MILLEAADQKTLDKKQGKLTERSEKYAVIISAKNGRIKKEAFIDNKELAAVIITDTITTIGENAFKGCTALESIVISASVTKIGSSPFFGCNNLTSITVAEGNEVYDSRENCNSVIDTEKNSLVAGCKETAITRRGHFFFASNL